MCEKTELSKTRISVIIPVWNTAPWMLEECVNSVLEQTCPVNQILLMDDGSTDTQTLECLDRLAEKSACIEIAHLPHGGISAARNAGLDRVQGTWLLFLDHDDSWEPEFVQGLLEAAKPDTQIVFCGKRLVSYQGKKILRNEPDREILLDPKRSPYFTCFTSPRLWNTAFVKSLGEQGRYPLGCIMEDEVFSAFVIAAAAQMAFVEQYGYNVRDRDDSTSRTRTSFNKAGPEQIPFDAFRNGLQKTRFASPWQEQVLHGRVLHAMMAASLVFCCYARPEQQHAVARRAASLLRECLPNYRKLAASPTSKALYSRGRRLAMSVYSWGVSLHMELVIQTVCTILAKLYYRLKEIN